MLIWPIFVNSNLDQNVITDKNLKLSDHIYIVFIISTHSIMKSLSMDLCASIKFKKNQQMKYSFWDLKMGERWRNADPAKLQLNSFLQPSGIAYFCHLGSQNVP